MICSSLIACLDFTGDETGGRRFPMSLLPSAPALPPPITLAKGGKDLPESKDKDSAVVQLRFRRCWLWSLVAILSVLVLGIIVAAVLMWYFVNPNRHMTFGGTVSVERDAIVAGNLNVANGTVCTSGASIGVGTCSPQRSLDVAGGIVAHAGYPDGSSETGKNVGYAIGDSSSATGMYSSVAVGADVGSSVQSARRHGSFLSSTMDSVFGLFSLEAHRPAHTKRNLGTIPDLSLFVTGDNMMHLSKAGSDNPDQWFGVLNGSMYVTGSVLALGRKDPDLVDGLAIGREQSFGLMRALATASGVLFINHGNDYAGGVRIGPEDLVVDSVGRVGVGTAHPSVKLEVVGAVIANSGIPSPALSSGVVDAGYGFRGLQGTGVFAGALIVARFFPFLLSVASCFLSGDPASLIYRGTRQWYHSSTFALWWS